MIAQSIPTGEAVAEAIEQGYALGAVKHCVLLRPGFNHIFGLTFVDGRKAVARLSDHRPRGEPNADYEAALLDHLRRSNVAVAVSIPTRDNAVALQMDMPEGPRLLMLFEHLDGEESPEDSMPDTEATGRGLALIHNAGMTYKGPASRYVLELPFLLDAPIKRICEASTTDEALRTSFTEIAQRLKARITAIPNLTRVACHGDCHGSNNFMVEGPDGTRIAAFFDFDDAGPGWLAYDLSVFIWNMLPRKVGERFDEESLKCWRHFLIGYRSVRTLEPHDFEAIAAFIMVRQIWLLGEYAGRIPVWGEQMLSTNYLHKQVAVLLDWESLTTPS
jgi:Ser/Thr protein kinase RdoA (MazF antagonist)